MAIRPILEYPDSRLALQSAAVREFDGHLRAIVDDLVETLHAHESIGLCAPQIDERQQILVMDHSGDRSDPQVFINPVITAKRRFGLVEERCLSVPDLSTLVFRATEIHVQAFNPRGEAFERQLNGMPAVCLQHEMDHFEGKLLADRINWLRRRRLHASLRRRAVAERQSVTDQVKVPLA
jgi:peptide deformylase